MFSIIFNAIIPVVFVLILGYCAGRISLITPEGARNFSNYIINFALPCTLFVGVFNFTPAQFENLPYVFTLLIGILIPFILGLFISYFFFKKSIPETALFGSNSGFPDMAYYGLPILLIIIGSQALLPIIIGNLVTSFFVVPVIVLMLNFKAGNAKDPSVSLSKILINTIKQPVVWAPILALVLMLSGITLAPLIASSIHQIGNTTGGVALFTLGVLLSNLEFKITLSSIIIFVLKNLLMPAIGLALALFFHLESTLAKGAVITLACPSATIGAMFSAKFQVGQKTVPAEIFVSNILGVFSMALWIFVVETVWGG